MNKKINEKIQSATFERLLNHLKKRNDVQNIDLMNLTGFCRNCLSKWYREEAKKKVLKSLILKQENISMEFLILSGKINIRNNLYD